MNNIRKILIAVISISIVVLIYMLATHFAGTSKIEREIIESELVIDDANDVEKLETVGSIGDLEPGQVTEARYSIQDPQSKEIKRIFGFSKLLRQAGDNWDLEKPYMKMLEDDYTCELISDSGTVQIELVGNQPTPKDARLEGNVVVKFEPTPGSSVKAGRIYMDDVIFSSDNSQFSTDGPVRFVSDDAEMVGTGMELIYNAMSQRIEYFRIIDLDFVHVKSYEKKASSETESACANGNQLKTDQVNSTVASTSGSNSNESINDPNAKPENKYRCVVNNNVVIKYGQQQIYSDEVVLSNILFSNNENKAEKAKSKPQTENNTVDTAENTTETGLNQDPDQQEVTEIFITCDGSITLRPMDFYKDTQGSLGQIQTTRTIEFKGQPVTIKEQKASSQVEQIANCGFLKFDIDQEMTSYRSQQNVSLNFQQAGAKLETKGSVHWQKRANLAVVNGPGTIFVNSKENVSTANQGFDTEMDFMGLMKVHFEDSVTKENLPSQQKVKFVDFLGGISAKMQDSMSNLFADSAKIVFDHDSQISHAHLDGNVEVASRQGNISSSSAKLYFAYDEPKDKSRLKYIELLENVKAFSRDDQNVSNMEADYSKLHFGLSQELVKADLKGDVILSSNDKYLYTQDMEVHFDENSQGEVYPKSAKTLSSAQISSKEQSNSSFWAKQIDYDLVSGNAVASGPVKFEFYTDTQANKASVPVIITAQGKAIFDSVNNRVTFSENVVGKMIEKNADVTQINDFTGDELVVDLNSREMGQADIKHILIQGQRVKLKSQKISGKEVINQVLLYCKKMDYFADEQEIIAKGGEGASEIQIDNSNADHTSDANSPAVSMEEPCFGRIMFFDTLVWLLDENKVIADGDNKRLYAGYVPVLPNGEMGEPKKVTAGHIEADFIQTPGGKNEISTLKASKGLSYKDEKYHFEGSDMFYEGGSSFVRITGSKGYDAMFNGVKVGLIEYNLNTGKATYELGKSPGMLY